MNKQSIAITGSIFMAAFCLPVLLSAPFAIAGDTHLPEDLISSRPGTICNDKVKVCYDASGVSVAVTGEIMGKEAAKNLRRKLPDASDKSFDRTSFNPV